MKRFAVIGDPIAHTLSPNLHQEVYRQLELDASFEQIHVTPNSLDSFINSNKLDGFNVTIPHKLSIIPFLKGLDELISNRTQTKADQLLDWINSIFPTNFQSKNSDIIINCTPLGMWPDTESMPEVEIQNGQILADTIYNPLETAWLKAGKTKGAKTIDGLDMFIAQGLASADIWFGEKISEKIKLENIKKVLKSELC